MVVSLRKVEEFTYGNSTIQKVLKSGLQKNSSALWQQRAVAATMTVITGSESSVIVTGARVFAKKMRSKLQQSLSALRTSTTIKAGNGMVVIGKPGGLAVAVTIETKRNEQKCGACPAVMLCSKAAVMVLTTSLAIKIKAGKLKMRTIGMI